MKRPRNPWENFRWTLTEKSFWIFAVGSALWAVVTIGILSGVWPAKDTIATTIILFGCITFLVLGIAGCVLKTLKFKFGKEGIDLDTDIRAPSCRHKTAQANGQATGGDKRAEGGNMLGR